MLAEITANALAIEPSPFNTTPNAAVFHARLHNKHSVIVKRLPPIHNRVRTYHNDPLRELQVHQHIHEQGGHVHIVRALGFVFNDDKTTDLVLELCAAGDLHAKLGAYSDQRMPPHEALNVLLQIARATQFLHRCGIAHRDISLENVLVSRNGVLKLCDFGLATLARRVMQVDAAVGKPYYMAPEVIAMVPYDPVQADIWSLGILFFILLTGSPLVQLASNDSADYRAVQAVGGCVGVLHAWKIASRFSSATLDLLDGMLQHEPILRFQSVTELLRHPAMVAASARAMQA